VEWMTELAGCAELAVWRGVRLASRSSGRVSQGSFILEVWAWRVARRHHQLVPVD